MKNAIKFAIAAVLLISLAACTSSSGNSQAPASSVPESTPSLMPTDSNTLEPTAEPTPEAETESVPEQSGVKLNVPDELIEYPEGMYKIGSDMPASVYFAFASENVIMASVTVKDGSGADAKPIAVDAFSSGHTMIAVSDGQYLDVKGCTLIDAGFTETFLDDLEIDYIPEGMYLAGFHFPAGEYKTIAEEGAVLSSATIFSDASQTSPIDVRIISGTGYITLKDGEYIRLRGARMEK